MSRLTTLRCFVAVELPAEVRGALADLQARLREDRPPVAWVSPAAMHLTLVFLGPTDSGLLPSIGAALRAAAAPTGPLELRLGRPGAFPDMRRPSVLWDGVEGDVAPLTRLQAAIAAALEPLGFPPERRAFHPHLTLGRLRRDAAPAEQLRLGAALGALPPPPALAWRVGQVALFRSELLPDGPRYTALDAAALGAGAHP